MSRQLGKAEVNHLRRLLAWVACEVGQTPEELIATARKIAPAVGDVSDEGIARLQGSLAKAAAIPMYVRKAVKSLHKVVAEMPGEIVDAEMGEGEVPALSKAPLHLPAAWSSGAVVVLDVPLEHPRQKKAAPNSLAPQDVLAGLRRIAEEAIEIDSSAVLSQVIDVAESLGLADVIERDRNGVPVAYRWIDQ